MNTTSPRFDIATATAAAIVNTLDPALTRAQQFDTLVFLILEAIYAAEGEVTLPRLEPSLN